jgi:hypothetical protein
MAKHNTPQMQEEADGIMKSSVGFNGRGINSEVNVGAKGNVELFRSFKFVLAFDNR